jgi:hypothetical protein
MSERWIEVVGWEKFQHYKDRDPVWIKIYTRLMSDDRWRQLTFHQRGVLVSLWLEYARGHRQIRGSTLTVSRRLGGRVSRATLEALRDAGFIRVSASKPLAPRYQDASPEKEEELEVLRTSSSSSNAGLRRCSVCGQVLPRNISREDHMRLRHGIEPVEA